MDNKGMLTYRKEAPYDRRIVTENKPNNAEDFEKDRTTTDRLKRREKLDLPSFADGSSSLNCRRQQHPQYKSGSWIRKSWDMNISSLDPIRMRRKQKIVLVP